jgi:hypothetical protein
MLSAMGAVKRKEQEPARATRPGKRSRAAPQNGQSEPHYHPKGASATCG